MYKALLQEWADSPPDVSYRFVVSPGTLRAAEAVAAAFLMKRRNRWRRAIAFVMSLAGYYLVWTLYIVFVSWLSIQAALLFSNTLLRILAFLITFLGLTAGLRLLPRRFFELPFRRRYLEFYSDNEFLLECRRSHLWFEERSAGAIRRWSAFEQVLEFEEGMWLFLRRGKAFGNLRGILVSKESLPNSCSWGELRAYIQQRIHEVQNPPENENHSLTRSRA